MFQLPKHLIIIDVETTGTNIEHSSIIQLGAVVFNKQGYLSSHTFREYIIPYTPEWTSGAEKIHKISYTKIQEIGKPLKQVLSEFEQWASTYLLCDDKIGYNYWLAQWSCGFDVGLLQNAYKSANRPYPFHYRVFDIASIVRFELAKREKLEMKCGEDICAKTLGIELEEAKLHDGLYDAKLAGKMLEKIIKESKCQK